MGVGPQVGPVASGEVGPREGWGCDGWGSVPVRRIWEAGTPNWDGMRGTGAGAPWDGPSSAPSASERESPVSEMPSRVLGTPNMARIWSRSERSWLVRSMSLRELESCLTLCGGI